MVCCDSNYQLAACVTLTSLYFNNPFNSYDTVIITNDKIDESKFVATFKQFNRSINFVCVNDADLKDKHISGHISKAANLWFFIPNLITEGVVLYLDCDTIVQCDIENIFFFDIDIWRQLKISEKIKSTPFFLHYLKFDI